MGLLVDQHRAAGERPVHFALLHVGQRDQDVVFQLLKRLQDTKTSSCRNRTCMELEKHTLSLQQSRYFTLDILPCHDFTYLHHHYHFIKV